MQIVDSLPQEHFIELRGLSHEFVGRLTIYQQGILFNLEIDIGLHRGGFASSAALAEALKVIKAEPFLEFAGLMG